MLPAGLVAAALAVARALPAAAAAARVPHHDSWQAEFWAARRDTMPARRGPPAAGAGRVPLVVTNQCEGPVWPGIATQAGTGPGTGGFELASGASRALWVGSDWQGRVWGRTNCTVNGSSCACKTGDCFAELDCQFSGAPPATLAEFNLAGGVRGMQTFYDISLVDGYNLPLGINSIPARNTTYIPPNLTNCACVATPGWLSPRAPTSALYGNATYPVPWEPDETNDSVGGWCPWPNLAFPPVRPGDGIYPYPDDQVRRPVFSPCKSACAATGSDRDCCIGRFHDARVCKPSLYSRSVKAVCPDAYSFAFDDQRSTFIIPKGGGWEVVLCPPGRSTDILRQLGKELYEIASGHGLSEPAVRRLRDAAYVESERGAAAAAAAAAAAGREPQARGAAAAASAVAAAAAWLLLW